MSHAFVVDEAHIPEFIVDWDSGMTARALAKKYHCHVQTINRTVLRLELVPRHHTFIVDMGLEAMFVEDWEAGMLTRLMAKKYGCSMDTISQVAKRLYLVPRKPGAPSIQDRSEWEEVNDDDSPKVLINGIWGLNHRTRVQIWIPTKT